MISLIFSAYFAAASFAPDSQDLCSGQSCTPPMKEISKVFTQDQGQFALSEDQSRVYSGSCYHLAPGMKGDQEHHGLVLFEPLKEGGLGSSGIFSFFASVDPYKELNVETARQYVSDRGGQKHTVTLQPSRAHIVRKYSDFGQIDDWFRTDESGDTLYQISHWNFTTGQQRSFCRLKKH